MTSNRYLLALRRSWVVIVAALILGAVAGIVASAVATPVYSASSKLYFSIGTGSSATDLNQGSAYTQAQMLSFAELATSPIVLTPVVESLGLDVTQATLAGDITATTTQGTALLEVTATASTGSRAAGIANAVAESLSSEIERLAPTATGSKKVLAVTIVTPATPPTSKSSPDTSRNLLAGLVLGLIIGVLVVALRQRIETRIDGPQALAEVTNAPLIGSIGRRHHHRPSGAGATSPVHVTEEDRQLAATLLSSIAGTPFTVLVTSAIPREGTTVTALGLSLALGERRQRVLLVEANLRRPSISHITGLPAAPGLAEAIAETTGSTSAGKVATIEGISVLVAGEVPSDPSSLLASGRMSELLESFAKDYDLVIVDVAPITVSADAAILGPSADAVLVVVDSTRVRAAKLASALDSLTSARIPVIGIVLNHMRIHVPRYTASARRSPAGTVTEAPHEDAADTRTGTPVDLERAKTDRGNTPASVSKK